MRRSRYSDKSVSKYWDRNANTWTDHVRKGYDVYRMHLNNPAFFKFVGGLKAKDVLDAGCGEGYNTRLFAKKGARMTGVDVSRKMMAYAIAEEKRHPLGIQYRVASFSDLSIFKDCSFDAVVSTMALMDGSDYAGAVKELYRVLRPGRDLFYSINHPCFVTPGLDFITDKKGRKLKLLVSDYFSKEQMIERWRFSHAPKDKRVEPFKVPRFPRTLSEYVNPLIETGFVLKRIEEPRSLRPIPKEYPSLKWWNDNAPIFLYVHASKP
jgi:ubiquinone/menaquinone biosynthesis C-methylase UbiE